MMHCTMDDLLALRAGEASVWARRHVAECATCQVALEALHQRAAQLKALPPLAPARDRWPAVRDLLRAERRGQRRRLVWSIAGVAAAAALAGILVGSGLGARNSAVLAAQLEQEKARSAAFEAQLQEYDAASRVQNGREAALAAELEDRIAVIDGALARLGRDAGSLNLWRQRADLLEQLYSVRVTRAAYVGL